MFVGVPKEIKDNEFRVGLTPGSVREYIAHGHKVFIETGAGEGINATDDIYEKAGATILPNSEEIFKLSEMIIKVKEPQPQEWSLLRENQILYAYLHLAADYEQTKGLIESGCTAVAYETITDQHGGLPLLAPMSEVAGRLSIQASATALQRSNGGMGILVGGIPGVPPAKCCIIGGGVVGVNAAKMALGLGADVTILDRSVTRMRILDDMFSGMAKTRYPTSENIEEEISNCDILIGAVLIPGASAPKIISADMLCSMKKGSVIADVSIDQGGCFETSRPTTHSNPTYVIDEVVHYCVANIPGSVPITSSYGLNNATLEYGLLLADCGGKKALLENYHLRNGLNIHKGKVTNKAVANALGFDMSDPLDVLQGN